VSRLRVEHFAQSEGLSSSDAIDRYHDRIAAAVVETIAPAERPRYHQALATALEACGSTDFEMLAGHFNDAGDRAKSFRYTLAAAEAATTALAFDRAARLYRQALERCEPGSETVVNQKLGDALASLGHGVQAAAAYIAATAGASAEQELELLRRAADQLFRSGYVDEALATLDRVLRDMGLFIPASPRRALLQLAWERYRCTRRGLSFRERNASDIAARDLVRVDTCWTVAIGLSMVDNLRGASLQSRHLRLALDLGEPFRLLRAVAAEAGYQAIGGVRARRRAQHMLNIANGLADRLGDSYAFGFTHLADAICKFLYGEWQGARMSSDRAEAIFARRPAGASWELASARLFSLWSSFYEGQWSQLARVPDLIAEAESRGDRYAATCQRIGLCNLAWLLTGDVEQAEAQVARGEMEWSRGGFHFQHYWLMLAAAHVDLYRGDAAGAHRRVTRSWALLRRELLLRVESLRLEVLWLRGRTALAAASLSDDPGPLLKDARRCAKKLLNETLAWSHQAGLLLLSACELRGGRPLRAVELLAAVKAESSDGSGLLPLLARARGAQLAAGQRRGLASEEWNEFMRRQGFAEADRWLQIFAPGFDPVQSDNGVLRGRGMS
jgi:hypothetical protein